MNRSLRTYQAIDAVAYAIAITALTVVFGGVLGLLLGGGWAFVEVVMFVIGWLLFGYGALKLRPTPPWKRNRQGRLGKIREVVAEETGTTEQREDTRVESIVTQTPGVGARVPPPDERLPMAAKLFIAGIVVLLASYLLEQAVIV